MSDIVDERGKFPNPFVLENLLSYFVEKKSCHVGILMQCSVDPLRTIEKFAFTFAGKAQILE